MNLSSTELAVFAVYSSADTVVLCQLLAFLVVLARAGTSGRLSDAYYVNVGVMAALHVFLLASGFVVVADSHLFGWTKKHAAHVAARLTHNACASAEPAVHVLVALNRFVAIVKGPSYKRVCSRRNCALGCAAAVSISAAYGVGLSFWLDFDTYATCIVAYVGAEFALLFSIYVVVAWNVYRRRSKTSTALVLQQQQQQRVSNTNNHTNDKNTTTTTSTTTSSGTKRREMKLFVQALVVSTLVFVTWLSDFAPAPDGVSAYALSIVYVSIDVVYVFWHTVAYWIFDQKLRREIKRAVACHAEPVTPGQEPFVTMRTT